MGNGWGGGGGAMGGANPGGGTSGLGGAGASGGQNKGGGSSGSSGSSSGNSGSSGGYSQAALDRARAAISENGIVGTKTVGGITYGVKSDGTIQANVSTNSNTEAGRALAAALGGLGGGSGSNGGNAGSGLTGITAGWYQKYASLSDADINKIYDHTSGVAKTALDVLRADRAAAAGQNTANNNAAQQQAQQQQQAAAQAQQQQQAAAAAETARQQAAAEAARLKAEQEAQAKQAQAAQADQSLGAKLWAAAKGAAKWGGTGSAMGPLGMIIGGLAGGIYGYNNPETTAAASTSSASKLGATRTQTDNGTQQALTNSQTVSNIGQTLANGQVVGNGNGGNGNNGTGAPNTGTSATGDTTGAGNQGGTIGSSQDSYNSGSNSYLDKLRARDKLANMNNNAWGSGSSLLGRVASGMGAIGGTTGKVQTALNTNKTSLLGAASGW